MIKSEYFIIKPLSNSEESTIKGFGNDRFIYFEIIDDKDNVVDLYDVINIDSDCVRIDNILYKNVPCTRIFPGWFSKDGQLEYDEIEHKIKCVSKLINKDIKLLNKYKQLDSIIDLGTTTSITLPNGKIIKTDVGYICDFWEEINNWLKEEDKNDNNKRSN